MVRIGLENFLHTPPKWLAGHRIGLLCNQASVDRKFRHTRERINARLPGQLTTMFSPQHGFFGEKQDNMIESDHMTDEPMQLPVFSLYGQTRMPTEEMLDGIDTLVVDLQDVGTRVYTFIYTLANCMEASKQYGKKVIVLDRPNPINGVTVEGNCLSKDCTSFVGRFPIPMRHGLTIGEMAGLFNRFFGIDCHLTVFPMTGWNRHMFFQETGLPWVAPSPNLPTPVSAMVYPGQVLWEGTNVSEGRGTTHPFELFGAPWIDHRKAISYLGGDAFKGVILRKSVFEPTSNKYQGEQCAGFMLHITDPALYKPYKTTLALIQALIFHHRDSFEWRPPPYEYEYHRLPMDLIIGDKTIRRRIENLETLQEVEASWQADLEIFKKESHRFRLYGNGVNKE